MTSPFLTGMAAQLAGLGIRTGRFEFTYMAGRHLDGRRRPPPKAELLIAEFDAAVTAMSAILTGGQRLVIGGKSMGGRVASMAADRLYQTRAIAGLAVIGYPFHPPGHPEKLRTAHLEELHCPTLIVQGERDPFGKHGEVASYRLSRAIRTHWITDGDHDMKPLRGSSTSHPANLAAAARAIADFIHGLETT